MAVTVCGAFRGLEVAIDGKTLRRSKALGGQAIRLVSAVANGLGLTLGQVKTAAKSNEITAIPELLDALLLKGCIVTIDALGCQTAIAAKIVEQESDDVLAVKNNQPTLAQAVEGFFEEAARSSWQGALPTYAEWIEKDPGRLETRRCGVSAGLTCLGAGHGWPEAKTLVKVEAIREIDGAASVEQHYDISSLPANAERMGAIVRGYWNVENGLHWVLDVAYGEDQARMREGNSAENFSILRRITLNLVKQDQSVKAGVKNRRLMAG